MSTAFLNLVGNGPALGQRPLCPPTVHLGGALVGDRVLWIDLDGAGGGVIGGTEVPVR